MSASLLRAVKLFVVVGGVLIIAGTATLITLLVKRGTRLADTPPPAVATSAAIPAGSEITSAGMSGRDLVLLGRAPAGQFVLVVDPASGARRRLLWLAPEVP